MAENNEEKLIKPPTFSFICFATVFFFLFYTLSIILFIVSSTVCYKHLICRIISAGPPTSLVK